MSYFFRKKKIFGKTYSFWIEGYLGYLTGMFILLACVLHTKPTLENNRDLILSFIQIGLIIFGFLLTFLSVIVQSDSQSINRIKKSNLLYRRFINYNKSVVFLSLGLAIYSYLLGYVNLDFIKSIKYLNIGLVSLFYALITKLTVDTVIFIRIFFILITPPKKNN